MKPSSATLPSPDAGRTISAWKAVKAQYVSEHTDPGDVEYWDRLERTPIIPYHIRRP